MRLVFAICLLAGFPIVAIAQNAVPAKSLEPRLVHLRSGRLPEWSEFPANSSGAQLEVHCNSTRNSSEWTLRLRQQDVKQGWRILLNGKPIADLLRDENDLELCFPIPVGTMADGENRFRIEPHSKGDANNDDIRVGQLRIEQRAVPEVLNEGSVDVCVTDAVDSQLLPCRITVVNRDGSLMQLGASSNEHLAVRPGTVYTLQGKARFGLPAGEYTIYAGRGFEYSLASADIKVEAGQTVQQSLTIHREVPTEGYVACDTHVHTLTHSGHGDATIQERLITLAGEGIELPVATDHNVHINYDPLVKDLGLQRYFTPVPGNEVTTGVGHFNVFPVSAGARVPDWKRKNWGDIFDEIFQTPGVQVAILNHARDLHSGVRPFGPKLHNAVIGENILGWPMRFNAMEVVNSSAVQTDDLQLFHDWMGLLNHGQVITPVGSSDSHDVARHFVGQGRTYIRCDDRDLGKIDVESAVRSFLQGRVLVSYGLIAELSVSDQYRSGDLVPLAAEESVSVEMRVLGPHWTRVDRVLLFSNGSLLREEIVPKVRDESLPRGVHWQVRWKLARPRHDVHLVAIALGPGIREGYWRTAKPYQPTSPEWTPRVIGCSGAVWLDGDGDGRRSTARDDANRVFAETQGDLSRLIAALTPFDSAIAAQAANLYRKSVGDTFDVDKFNRAAQGAAPQVQAGFREYLQAWRANELAKAEP